MRRMELAHFGIKGMKWGVRKSRKSSNFKKGSGRRTSKKPRKKAANKETEADGQTLADDVKDFATTLIGAEIAKKVFWQPYAVSALRYKNKDRYKQTRGRKAAEAVLFGRTAYGVGKVAYKIGQRKLERHNSRVNDIAKEMGYATYDWKGRRI